MSVRLAPQHCPAEHDLLVYRDEQPPCSAGHLERTTAIKAAGRWLAAAAAALAQGSVLAAACPHPDGSGRDLHFTGIDPQCLAVVLTQGRIGRFDADVAYIGLCAQQPSGRWQGLAGAFVWLCSSCQAGEVNLGPRQLQATLASSVPGLSPWDEAKIPAELAWGPGWWDERWIATYGLGTDPGDLWQERPFSTALAPVPLDRAVLLRLGEEWSGTSSLLLVTSPSVGAVRELLELEYGAAALRCRRGPTPELALLPGTRAAAHAAHWRLNVRQGPPTEPVLLRLHPAAGSVPIVRLTQQPRRLAQQLVQQGVAAPAKALDVWSLPRLTLGGVIDGDALAALHQELRSSNTFD